MAKKVQAKKPVKAGKSSPKKLAKKASPEKKKSAAPKKAAPKSKPAAKASKPVKPARPAAKAATKTESKVKKATTKPAAAAKPAPAPKAAASKPLPPAQKVNSPAPKAAAKDTVEDTRSRYSDAELKEFRDLINKKLEEASRDYELLKNTLSHKDDHGTDDTSPTFKLLEDGSDVLSKEETAHLAARQEKYIQNLKNALIRIQNKTYGICRVTGKLIPKERLRSVPHATLSIDAKLGQNK
jgi:RNA polymerase-binding transcription factor DksA